jgi:hypothetical protein
MHGRMVLIFALTLSTILVGMLRSSGVYAAVILSPTSGNSQVLFDGPADVSDYNLPWSTNVNTHTGFNGLSFNGRLFGKTVGELGGNLFATNLGNVNFSGNLDNNSKLGNYRIAPLWDDYVYLPQSVISGTSIPPNRILFHQSVGNYIGVTWQNVVLFTEAEGGVDWPITDRTVQMLWFEGDTVLNGFQFHRDDIAFSYIANKAGTDDFGPMLSLIGLDSASDGSVLADPKRSDGLKYFREIDGDKMPWQAGQFFLFRPTSPGASTYSVTLQPIPDPPQVPLPGTGIIFAGLGLIAVLKRRIQSVLS